MSKLGFKHLDSLVDKEKSVTFTWGISTETGLPALYLHDARTGEFIGALRFDLKESRAASRFWKGRTT